MNTELRTNVQTLANETLETIRDAILGKAPMSEKIKEAVRIVSLGIKAGHLDQMAEYTRASLALRLIPHLPKDVNKDEYVKITNPQIQGLKLKRLKS